MSSRSLYRKTAAGPTKQFSLKINNTLENVKEDVCPFRPGGDGAVPQQPVDKLLSHDAVGVSPQPVPVVLELHPCAVVADFLPQFLKLG